MAQSAKSVSEQLDVFFSRYQACSFKEGDILIHTGEFPDMVYFLKAGVIKQAAISPEGQEVIITMYKPGAFFPLIWAIQEKAVPYDFVAVTNGHGWRAPAKEVIAFLKKSPDVTFDLASRLLSGLEGLGRKVEFALEASAYLRVSEALLTLAYRFGKSEAPGMKIEMELTHQKLADITGLTRETVSRELIALRKNKLVNIEERSFVLPDLGKLEEMAGLEKAS